MSSHREAPEISKDPVADSTDVYAFVSPDSPDTVTLIANYVPLQEPAGGPNFYEFGDDVLYEIHVDNNGDGEPDITYQFRFRSELTTRQFPVQHGPIESLNSPNWNRRQFYSVSMTSGRRNHASLAPPGMPAVQYRAAVNPGLPRRLPKPSTLGSGRKVFAGQRADGFYVDLGAIFDLGDLRPFARPARHLRSAQARAAGSQRHPLPKRAQHRDTGADH